jgi:hypothetical protein
MFSGGSASFSRRRVRDDAGEIHTRGCVRHPPRHPTPVFFDCDRMQSAAHRAGKPLANPQQRDNVFTVAPGKR